MGDHLGLAQNPYRLCVAAAWIHEAEAKGFKPSPVLAPDTRDDRIAPVYAVA
jgi:hypothetical protein